MLNAESLEMSADWFSRPFDSILSIIRRRSVAVELVAGSLDGGMRTLRELSMGTRAIDQSIADSLATTLGGSPSFWLRRQANYEKALERTLGAAIAELDEWLEHVPSPMAQPRGRLSEVQREAELRKRMAFFGVNNLRAWHSRYGSLRDSTQFRTSRAFQSKDGPVSLWLRQGELEAALRSTSVWSPAKLRDLLPEVVKLSKVRQPENFLSKLQKIGADAGVAIVFIRTPKGCRASGASRLVSPEKAMVLLSFRHLSDDHFWFTLFHEFGHLLLHGAEPFVDTDDTALNEREKEANDFAESCIIPASQWEKFSDLRTDMKSIVRFSVSLGISPGLVVGQLQNKEMMGKDKLNYLKRRWTWDEIDDAIAKL